jgi:2-polyprenyl-6-methoxyphenol hydroxylase-like FAD-dependent oxidoreductase
LPYDRNLKTVVLERRGKNLDIAVVGAGPAGLYFSYLIKKRRPKACVRVFEQNPAEATFGFGVVFSDRALEFLREDDPETYDLITPEMQSWSEITLDLCGEIVPIDGVGFSAIGRLELLRLLRARAASEGVGVEYGCAIHGMNELSAADLIIGADGANSIVRQWNEAAFGTNVTLLTNKFAWFGTTKPFETLTQTFRRNQDGTFNAHHYRYSPRAVRNVVGICAAQSPAM